MHILRGLKVSTLNHLSLFDLQKELLNFITIIDYYYHYKPGHAANYSMLCYRIF